jgi:hypothetical protein
MEVSFYKRTHLLFFSFSSLQMASSTSARNIEAKKQSIKRNNDFFFEQNGCSVHHGTRNRHTSVLYACRSDPL